MHGRRTARRPATAAQIILCASVLADFSIRLAQDPEPVEGHIGDMYCRPGAVTETGAHLGKKRLNLYYFRSHADEIDHGSHRWSRINPKAGDSGKKQIAVG